MLIIRGNMGYLDFFREMCAIPHGSGNTKAISDWLVAFAVSHNLEHYQDSANNVVIIKEASEGFENREPVIIQGHMDMVAVHDADVSIDMEKEGLRLKEEGDFLFAEGTSLGGDDGIAVAYGLALLDSDYKFPRIELVVTVDEEVGMLGADVIDLSMLKGHTMLNIDSEDEGVFLVSCAGGARVDMHFPMQEVPGDMGAVYEISIENLAGGHSGTEINKGRANAIVLMGRILKKLSDARLLLAIHEFYGGTADNAICAACNATVLCKPIEPELFEIIKFEVMEEYFQVETGAVISLDRVAKDPESMKWYTNHEHSFTSFMAALPNGVIAMSADIEGLVETSLNHGIIRLNAEGVDLSFSVRSNIDERKNELVKSLVAIAGSHGAKVHVHGNYPGWAYRKDSPLRNKMVATYERMYGKTPRVEALHAGLECGVLATKINDLDCVSFGPDLFDIHTTKERLSLSSAERVWQYLLELVTN